MLDKFNKLSHLKSFEIKFSLFLAHLVHIEMSLRFNLAFIENQSQQIGSYNKLFNYSYHPMQNKLAALHNMK